MDLQRERRVEELFAAALELEAGARAAFVEREAGGDAELRAELESLLAHHAGGERLLASSELSRALHPERIGAYRVLRVLGEGGMGVVYLAEQENPRRAVALKVIRPGLASPATLRRFEHEAQLLARLRHPGIAQVFEAGAADTGFGPQPYFAMEYVNGATLSEFASGRSLSMRDKLALLADVCDAVEHAHRRGVIHRDLKPSNVLVDESSGASCPKVLDFGVARAADDEVRATSMRTNMGQVIGTLPYMSPEQASGDPDAIDHRADVYSLGVIGYELLCGRLPLDLAAKPLPEALRILSVVEPAPLSRVDPRLAGDVSTIFVKALEKDRERRYATARDLSDDLRRFLDDRPIAARPPSSIYVLSKFARRNKTLVGGVIAVVAALALGLAGTTRQSILAAAARDRADGEARRARAVAAFQRSMLTKVRPDVSGRNVKVADVLDAAAAGLPGELAGDPLVEAGVRSMLGESYEALGLPQEAETQYRAALPLLRGELGAEHLETLELEMWLAGALLELGRAQEAEDLLAPAYAAVVRAFGADHRVAVHSELRLAHIAAYHGDRVAAEQKARECWERRRRVWGEAHEETLEAYSSIGYFVMLQGRPADAEPILREALERGIALQGERHRSNLLRLNHLACCLRDQAKLEDAGRLFQRAMEIGADLLGPEHVDVLTWINNLASVYERTQRYDAAEPLYRYVLDARLQLVGEEHRDTLIVMNNLGLLLLGQKRYDDARPLLERSLEVKQRVFGREHHETLSPRFNLGLMHILREDPKAALPYLRDAAEIAPCALPPGHFKIGQFVEGYGAVLKLLERYDEAEPVLLDALGRMRASFPDTDPRVVAIADRLHDLYGKTGNDAKRAEMRARFGVGAE